MTQADWYAIKTNSGSEFFVADRINSIGRIAHVPKYFERQRKRNGKPTYFSEHERPLFATYLFAKLDDTFRKEKIETSRVRLTIIRKKPLTDGHMSLFNEVALAMTAAGGDIEEYRLRNMPKPKAIGKGDIMKLLHGAMRGETVEVLVALKNRITVQLQRFPGSMPVDVKADALGRVA